MPTNAELGILRVLWKRGPSTVREAHEELSSDRKVGYTTVLKLMQIMADKGLLERTDQGRAHLYRPVESETTSKRGLASDLMERAFDGSARELLMHALGAKTPSAEELAEIRQMLEELKGRLDHIET